MLPNKRSDTYRNLFKSIINICKHNGVTLKISKIVIDFEKGIHKAVEQIFPLAQIIGCRFHLAQSWFKKIQEYGLIAEYKNENSEVGRWLRMTFGLTFLSPHDVSECFVFDLLAIAPIDEKIQKYSDYLTDNYIREESLFPPSFWADNSAELTRTTNACEAFYCVFL